MGKVLLDTILQEQEPPQIHNQDYMEKVLHFVSHRTQDSVIQVQIMKQVLYKEEILALLLLIFQGGQLVICLHDICTLIDHLDMLQTKDHYHGDNFHRYHVSNILKLCLGSPEVRLMTTVKAIGHILQKEPFISAHLKFYEKKIWNKNQFVLNLLLVSQMLATGHK